MIELAERKGRGRKISIVHIAQILLSESDAEHPLSPAADIDISAGTVRHGNGPQGGAPESGSPS